MGGVPFANNLSAMKSRNSRSRSWKIQKRIAPFVTTTSWTRAQSSRRSRLQFARASIMVTRRSSCHVVPPKPNPLHGRWITVSGGQAAFIKEAIKTGMLGAAEANKIQADTDHEKTGGMYLRINQFGDQCTVDASVAKYARAKRTWRSGHYFYEPLVSGGNLMGVWVLPEEYRKIGFFWEMDSGKCFRIERRAFPAGPYTFMRQSTEVAGKISFVLYVKVSNDPESAPIPVQSRDFTALAGRDNVCTNLGKPYPCIAKDLDYPKK